MIFSRMLITLFAAGLIFNTVLAAEKSQEQRVADLEKRVAALEKRLEELNSSSRWKDPILWHRLKRDMTTGEVKKLLGKPTRVEEQIFKTWYYHPTSKRHSYVWFDEGEVLGWKAPRK